MSGAQCESATAGRSSVAKAAKSRAASKPLPSGSRKRAKKERRFRSDAGQSAKACSVEFASQSQLLPPLPTRTSSRLSWRQERRCVASAMSRLRDPGEGRRAVPLPLERMANRPKSSCSSASVAPSIRDRATEGEAHTIRCPVSRMRQAQAPRQAWSTQSPWPSRHRGRRRFQMPMAPGRR